MILLPLHVRRRLRSALPRMLARVPAEKQAQFKRSVIGAVLVFLASHRPTGAQHDLRRLADSVTNPRSNPALVWSQVSPYARDVVRQYDDIMGDLPDPGRVPPGEFREELKKRVIRGQVVVNEKQQRRVKTQIAGARPRGRPKAQDVDALVALLAAGYTRATGSTPTKRWSLEDRQTDFELILRLVFRAVGLPDTPSRIKSALDRHKYAIRRP